MTPEEHANVAVSKLKAAGFQVTFAHNKTIAEAIRAALADSEEFARIEQSAASRVKDKEGIIARLEHERDTAISPAATFRERLEKLVNAVIDAGQNPKEYSRLWVEIALSKELLKSPTGKNLIDRLKTAEDLVEATKAGKGSGETG